MENAFDVRVDKSPSNAALNTISDKLNNEVFQLRGGFDVRPGADNSIETGTPFKHNSIFDKPQDSQTKPEEKPAAATDQDWNAHGTLIMPAINFSKPQDAQSKPQEKPAVAGDQNWNAHGTLIVPAINMSTPQDAQKKPQDKPAAAGEPDWNSHYIVNAYRQMTHAKDALPIPTNKPAQDPTTEINYNASRHWR